MNEIKTIKNKHYQLKVNISDVYMLQTQNINSALFLNRIKRKRWRLRLNKGVGEQCRAMVKDYMRRNPSNETEVSDLDRLQISLQQNENILKLNYELMIIA